jgi:protocatechuate 3,4-dioxygenase beta subunit
MSVRSLLLSHPAHTDRSGVFHSASSRLASDVIVLVPQTTEGPYFEQLTDYWNDGNMLDAAKAGASPNVTKDRTSVLAATPLTLSLNVYSVSGSVGTPLQGANVYVWHCDAYGIYSSVALKTAPSNLEDTTGQYWSRSYQTTDSTGATTFKTIIPGWYTGRALHYHIRIHLANAKTNTTFAATTQLFPSDAVLTAVKTISPYTGDTQRITLLAADMVYTQVKPASLAKQLILDTIGSAPAGYTTTFNLGIAATSESK